MKRKKWFCWLWQCTLLLWQWVVVAPRPAGMGHIFLLTLLWLRAFNCRSRLGWSMSLFLVALAFGFSAHHICYGSELLTVAPNSGGACLHSLQLLRPVSLLTVTTNLNYERQEMVRLLVVVVYPAAPAVGGGCTPPCWHRPCLLPLLWLRAFNCRSRLGWGVPPFLVAFASGFGAHHICYGSELLTVAPDSGRACPHSL